MEAYEYHSSKYLLKSEWNDLSIDPNLKWDAYSYLKLLLPEVAPTRMQEVSFIYDGKESNKFNLYVGVPLDSIHDNSNTLSAYSHIYVNLLKPDRSTTSTIFEISADMMNVQWNGRNFSGSYTLNNYYTEDYGIISDDGMSIQQLTIQKKSLNNSGDVTLSLKADESIHLDSVYHSYYTSNLFLLHSFSGPDYMANQEELLNKFNIKGRVEIIPGEVYTIQSMILKMMKLLIRCI